MDRSEKVRIARSLIGLAREIMAGKINFFIDWNDDEKHIKERSEKANIPCDIRTDNTQLVADFWQGISLKSRINFETQTVGYDVCYGDTEKKSYDNLDDALDVIFKEAYAVRFGGLPESVYKSFLEKNVGRIRDSIQSDVFDFSRAAVVTSKTPMEIRIPVHSDTGESISIYGVQGDQSKWSWNLWYGNPPTKKQAGKFNTFDDALAHMQKHLKNLEKTVKELHMTD